MENGKTYKKCEFEKELEEFYLDSNKCKSHQRNYSKLYDQNNLDVIKNKAKIYRENNRDKIREISKDFRINNLPKVKEGQKKSYYKHLEKNKEYRKEYIKNFPDKVKNTQKQSKEKNKEKIKITQKLYCEKNREKLNKYAVDRRNSNPILKASHNIRTRICQYLKINNIQKNNKTFDIIGCTPNELKIYIENKFSICMTWENYGYNSWHIDHVIPLDSAETIDDVKLLCNYKNLQPLWWYDNLKKSNKYEKK